MNIVWCKNHALDLIDAPGFAKVAAFDKETGTVYMSAAMAGMGERSATLCAAWDGLDMLESDGHAYIPIRWFIAQEPGFSDQMRRIEARIRDLFGWHEGATP